MARAALLFDQIQIPRQLSFKRAVQAWRAWQQRGGGAPNAVCIRGPHLQLPLCFSRPAH
jgi:hypothetical protein